MNQIAAHVRQRLSLLRSKGMFIIEVTADERAKLLTALNHHIGELLAHVGQLSRAHGAAAPIVSTASHQAALAQRLYDKVEAAPFKLVEVQP